MPPAHRQAVIHGQEVSSWRSLPDLQVGLIPMGTAGSRQVRPRLPAAAWGPGKAGGAAGGPSVPAAMGTACPQTQARHVLDEGLSAAPRSTAEELHTPGGGRWGQRVASSGARRGRAQRCPGDPRTPGARGVRACCVWELIPGTSAGLFAVPGSFRLRGRVCREHVRAGRPACAGAPAAPGWAPAAARWVPALVRPRPASTERGRAAPGCSKPRLWGLGAFGLVRTPLGIYASSCGRVQSSPRGEVPGEGYLRPC